MGSKFALNSWGHNVPPVEIVLGTEFENQTNGQCRYTIHSLTYKISAHDIKIGPNESNILNLTFLHNRARDPFLQWIASKNWSPFAQISTN